MSGGWKRGTARLLRHRRPKGPGTDGPSLKHRATPRLYTEQKTKTLAPKIRFPAAGFLKTHRGPVDSRRPIRERLSRGQETGIRAEAAKQRRAARAKNFEIRVGDRPTLQSSIRFPGAWDSSN